MSFPLKGFRTLPATLPPRSCLSLQQTRRYSKFDLYGNSPVPANKQRFVPQSGSYPKGFLIGSTHAGIKPDTKDQPDLVLIASDKPSCGAAVFTKNEFAAPSITVSKQILQETKGHGIQGVVVNSWCANIMTGAAGLEDTRQMSIESARQLKSGDCSVMVMHTGMGGQRLPMDRIISGIPIVHQNMGASYNHWLKAARGICTTDTFPKLGSRTFSLPSSPGVTFSIAGITKGAGMIHPNMATTLGVFCTDAPVTPGALQRILSVAADKSYNCISIEGDTSTNDMVTLLANGAAGGTPVQFDPSAGSQSKDFVALQRTLIEHMADMAKLVVRDGEGASKFITIRIKGSPSYAAAKHIASVIARSMLFKANPDWGMAWAALGYSLADTEFAGKGTIVPDLTSISAVLQQNGTLVKFLDKGVLQEVDTETTKMAIDQEEIEVVVDLRDDGGAHNEAVYWTCDVTHDWITINGDF